MNQTSHSEYKVIHKLEENVSTIWKKIRGLWLKAWPRFFT